MKNIFLVGTGNRAYELFIKPLHAEKYPESKIIGIYDSNFKRAEFVSSLASYHIPVIYSLDQIENSCHPDIIVIATPDYTHVPLISYLLSHTNARIMCEKPLCTSLEQAYYLKSLSSKLKNRISVLLNSRFMPINTEIKKILQTGCIGIPLKINYHWNIDIQHGAEYFRRWHSDQNKSGGLLVHKSCHHFDLLNWWLEDTPYSISSEANTIFYTPTHNHGHNCRNCDLECPLRINLNKQPLIQKMYFDVESEDGYIRDKCIYYGTTVNDTFTVNIKYEKGTQVSYSINFYSPDFSWNISIIGEYGTLSTYENASLCQNELIIDYNNGDKSIIPVKKNPLKHNGADLEIRKILLSNQESFINGLHIGTCEEGITSSLIGILSNISQKEGDLCENPFITID